MPKELVLVTGATGFIATHIVKLLLQNGYRVRGSVRDNTNETKNKPVMNLHEAAADRLELVNGDLNKAEGWKEAVQGCTYVLHVASPFPAEQPRDENELIRPAVDGTLNVLKAVAEVGGVKRVVLTSSIAAVTRGHSPAKDVYSEADWTNPNAPGVTAYEKSKTLAEKAAWEFVESLEGDKKFELVVLNPGFVLGPMLTNAEGTSAAVVKRILTKGFPLLPKLCFGVVDVRDVAQAHVNAIKAEDAAGKRITLVSSSAWFKDMALSLSKEFKQQGYNVPTTEAPGPLIWLGSWFDRQLRSIYSQLGVTYQMDNDRMKNILGIKEPIPMEKSIVAQAYSLIEQGLVNKTSNYKPQRAADEQQ